MSGGAVVYNSRGLKFTIADDHGDPGIILSRLPPFPFKESSTLQPAGRPGRWLLVLPDDIVPTVMYGSQSLQVVVPMSAPGYYFRRLVERLSIFRSHVPGRSFQFTNIEGADDAIFDQLKGENIITLGDGSSPHVPFSLQVFHGGSSPTEIAVTNRYDRVFASQLLDRNSALIFGPFKLSPFQRLDTLFVDDSLILDLVPVRIGSSPASHVVDAFCFYFRVFETRREKSPRPMKPVVRQLVQNGKTSPAATGNLFNLFSFFFQRAREIGELL
jgi:hypothetical protein